MEITEVRIKLMEDPTDRLSAFCSITLDDCFVVRDLKIIQGAKGAFVAMPSRKLSDRCPKCHFKNQIRASFCNQCGVKLHPERALKDDDGRAKLYADIAHPINSVCRDMIQKQVIKAFDAELIRANQSGYSCTYDDFEEERFAQLVEAEQGQAPNTDSQKPEEKTDSKPEVVSQQLKEKQSQQPAPAETTMNLETEDGTIHRVDSRSEHKANNPKKCDSPSEQAKIPQAKSTDDPFGDGII